MAKAPDLFSPVLACAGELAQALRRDARDAEEQQALTTLLGEVQRFCKKQVDGSAIDHRGSLGPELLGAVAERGWFGLTVPERYGGAGLSIQAACRVVSELAGFNGSLGTCVGLHSGLGLYSLIHLASEPLRERYLPEVATGTRIAAFAATEPSAGSDIGAMRTTLSEVDGKLILRGSKCYVTNGGLCGVLTTVARSPGLGGARAGHTMVLLDPSASGVARQAEERKLGLKGSSTITIDYDDVVVPVDHVIGEASLGLDYAHRALTWGRTFMAAGCLGPAQATIAQVEEHAATRVQFGRPLLKFPLVRHQLAECRALVYAMESVIRLVCHGFDSGSFDIALPSAVAKVLCSESAWAVVDRGIQILGGLGYMEDANLARRLRDLRVTRIFEGANDVLRLSVASATLGWATDPLAGARPVGTPVDALVARVVAHLDRVRKQHGVRLFDRQLLQSHLADAIISAYGALACAIRATAAQGQELATAEFAMRLLTERADASLAAAEHLDETRDRARVDAVLDG